MWTCPACDRSFANENQWHSCLRLALAEHLATKSDLAVELYRAVAAALHDCGEFRIHPQKTRVAFIARMTFAGVGLARRWADLSFNIPTPAYDERVRRIELYGPTSFGHHLRLHEPADLDDDVRGWLCAAHRRGCGETLDPDAHVEPLVGIALERLAVPLRSRAAGGTLTLPRYAAEALEAAPGVIARIRGEQHVGTITDGTLHVADTTLGALGLGEGDTIDVVLAADV